MIIGDEVVAAVLAPLDGGVGPDGRVDEGAIGDAFRELRFQRKAIFRAEQRIAMGQDPDDDSVWDWATLADGAAAYLSASAKDLEVMAMLLEASIREDGLAGLVAGTALLADLVEAFWEQGLHPPEDEDDGIDGRFLPISSLSGGSGDKDGTLVMPLRRLVLAGNAGGDLLQYMDRITADAQFAAAQSAAEDGRENLNREAQAALDAIDATARRLTARPIKVALAQLDAAEAAWRRTVGFIFERTRPRAPAASRVSDELRSMREWLQSLLAKLPDDAPATTEEAAPPGDAPMVNGAAGSAAVQVAFNIGQITRREEALRAVQAAADYFERFEPLSPLGSTLREVDRRARLTLDTLLQELIPDSSTRETYYWRLGIKPPEGTA